MLQQVIVMMPGDSDDIGLDPLKKEALNWVRRLTGGTVTAADAEQLRLWRARSPQHAAAFAAASRLWRDLHPAGENLRRREAQAASRSVFMGRRAFIGGGLAAASIAAGAYVAVRPPLDLWPSLNELAADYRTRPGEQREIALSDDISIRLNTRTSIARQPIEAGIERVKLIAGEASFSNFGRGHTLAVAAADKQITAIAARFDVSYLQNDEGSSVCATCLQGELQVERGADQTVISAGQQLRYMPDGAKQIKQVDLDIVSAWHQGALVFRATPLQEVIDEVNRYRAGKVIVTNAELGRAPVSGRFRISRIDDILIQIEQAFGAKLRMLPGGLVLLS